MAVRVSNVTLTDIPGHVCRWKWSNDTELQSEFGDGINLGWRRHPPAHPHAPGLIVPGLVRHRTTARALAVLAEKDLSLAADDGAEGWWITPSPMLLPAQLLKPRK